jgi:adenylate cyclase class IV
MNWEIEKSVKQTEASTEKPVEKKQSPIKYILDQQKFRTRQDLLRLRLAIDVAESVLKYDRELLHDIYRLIIDDPDLWSHWESRKMKTK